MNDKETDELEEDHHPTIIETEEKEIPERKPPNNKIVSFSKVDNEKKDET